jgi:hypothetical protein
VGNTTPGIAGGLWAGNYSDLDLMGVIVSHNQASGGAGGIGIGNSTDADLSYCDVWGNVPDDFSNFDTDPTGTDGNISEDPLFMDLAPADALDWDLHLDPVSPAVDTSDTHDDDPDGSRADMGGFGGPNADDWDLDGDGYPSWWQPGVYDTVLYPTEGWDCDDLDEAVFPGSGC